MTFQCNNVLFTQKTRGSAWRCCVASNMYLVLGDLRRPTPQKYLFPIRMKYSILFVMKYYLLVCNKKWFDNLFLNERAKSACKCLFGHNLAKIGREIARAGWPSSLFFVSLDIPQNDNVCSAWIHIVLCFRLKEQNAVASQLSNFVCADAFLEGNQGGK